MKKIRRTLAVLLAIIMFVQPMVFAASVSDFSDFPSGWSSEAMTAAVENGLFVGMEDGKIHPQDNLTRAQLAAFITRAFGATIEADISILEDVKPADWFYHDVAKAYNMGALTGKSDTTFIPDAEITREEVFVVIGRTLCITSDNYDILNHFTDSANISDWAKPAISGLLAKGYINGYPDGTLLPKGNITREELAQLFHNIFRTYISEPGYHTAVNKPGSVMVRVPGVILESVSVDGDVVIADGVGAGDFDINTVTVGGRLLARGGEGYVTVKNTKIGESVVVFDRNGTVNFYNYRDEAPFKVLYEYTPATFLTKKAEEVISGGGSSSGGKAITRYTVKFDYPEGMSDKTIYVRKNYYAEVPTAIPAIEGKNFMYWSADTDDTPFNFEGTQITKDYTFHPVFEVLVPLYDSEGNLIPGTPLHIKDGDTIPESMLDPYIPEKEGYDFDKWVDEDGDPYDFSTPVTGPIELKPSYTIKTFTTVFTDENGDPIPGTEQTIDWNTPATIIPENPTCSDDTKEFAYWTVNGNPVDPATYPITEGTTFVPYFTDKPVHTVTFGKVDPDDYSYDGTTTLGTIDGFPMNIPTLPMPEGYEVKYWTDTPGTDALDTTAPAYDTTNPVTDDGIVLYPVIGKQIKTITFNDPNGDPIPGSTDIPVEYGDPIPAANIPADPTSTDPSKEFAGWSVDGGATTIDDITTYPIKDDVEFTPVFKTKQFAVKFMADSLIVDSQNIDYGTCATAPADPSKTGYTFGGWTIDGINPVDVAAYTITAATTFNAIMTANTYTVTLNTNGGTINSGDVTEYTYGTGATLPTDVTKPGHTFDGWYDNAALTGYPVTSIPADAIENKTFYAKYTPETYEVKYLKEDGTELETVSATYGEPIPTPSTTPTSSDPTKEFAGWSVDGVTPIDLNTYPINADTELKPVFTDKDVFVVTFKTFDGTNYVDYTTVNAVDGLAVAAPADPTLTGYDFNYWSETEGGAEFDMTTPITADKTLYAKFTVQQYEVKYLKEDGTELETVTATYGEPIPAPSTTPTSSDPAKEFAGWSVDGVTPIDLDTYPISADTELKPVFTDKDTFTVTFKTFDGTNYIDYTTVPAVDGLAVAAPADPALTGYTFKYWSETEGGAEFDMTTPITADKTLYAVFEAAQFTVTFYEEDGTTVIGTAQTVDYGDYAVAETAPEVTGKAFKYWTVDGSEVDPDTYAITEDTDFVAYYEDTVTVRFFDLSLDYDDQMISSKTVDVGDYLASTDVPDTFVHNGYKKNASLASVYGGVDYTHEILEGWYYISGGKWVEFDPTQAIMNDIDVYMNCKKATAYLSIPAISSMPFPFKDWYRTDIRAFDSFKDTLFINETPTVVSFNTLVKDTVYDKLAEKNLITDAGEIKNFHRFVYLRDVLGNSGIETMIWDFIGNTVDEDGEFRDYIREKLTSVTPSTRANAITAVKASFNTLLAGPKANNFKNGVKSVLKDAVMNDDAFLRAAIKMYADIKSATPAGKAEMQGVLEGILDTIGSPAALGYKAQVPTLVSAPKAQRDEAIDAIVDMLDASTIAALSPLFDTLVSGILSTTSVDDAFATSLLDYMGEPANTAKLDAMVNAIVNNLDSETLTTIATILGHSGTCRKTELVNEFIRELENEDLATVTDENSFMFDPIIAKAGNYTFDKLWAKVPAKFQSLLPKEYLEDMFNRFYEPYVNSMKDAVANAHADPAGKYYFGTGINIEINPVSDIIKPAFEYYFTAKGFVIGKLSTSHYSTYLTYYNNNPYADAYEEFLSVDKWFDGSDAGYAPELSGYSLKSFGEYYKIVEAFADIVDDAMMWYYDDANVPAAAREAVFDALKARICGALNMICRFIEDYEANGIPTSLTELVLDLEDDPEMIEYINKFGVKKYLDKIAGISYADKAYATVEARLDARISALFTKFVSSKLDRYYNDGEYNKAKEVLANLFCAEPGYTVDSLFTEVFGGADSGEVGASGIKLRFERGYEIPVTHSDIR